MKSKVSSLHAFQVPNANLGICLPLFNRTKSWDVVIIKIDFKKDKKCKEPVIFKTAECWIADAFLSWTGLAGEVSRKRDLIYVCKFSSMHQMIDDGNMSNVIMIDL